jgi:RsiW-degrading membrane proteinase PrsW (M82 family)
VINLSTILFALGGGFIPALVWLFFWLREDHLRPEPLLRITGTFLAGAFAVLLVLPLQKFVDHIVPSMSLTEFGLWAIIEESFKFGAAYFIAIRSLDNDEPLDPLMYMIVAALGFVALENTLFIINPLLQQDIAGSILTGNLRFIGASLLHIVSSSTIGVALALTFYKGHAARFWWTTWAFIVSIFIHTAFNLFIINGNDFGTLMTFATVWAGITILMLIFEKVKTLRRVIPQSTSTENIQPLS